MSQIKLTQLAEKVASQALSRDLQKKEAIRRNMHQTSDGPKRAAFEEMRHWMVSDMEPAISRLITRKLRDMAGSHGVSEGEILAQFLRPPTGETRKDLLEYAYSLIV
jgi:hypothetical protein